MCPFSLPFIFLISSLASNAYASPLYHRSGSISQRAPPSGWSYLGCVAEPSGGARVLSTKITASSPSMTQETCLASCINAGYSFAGLEFGAECWCGNNPVTNLSVLPDTSCNKACGGDSSEKCGGSYILSLFGKASQVSSNWTYVGCFSDSTARTLPSTSSTSAAMTPATCQASCKAAGYTFAGVEASSECWCSNSIANGSRVAESQCSATCSGSSEKCGGNWAIGVYRRTLSPAWKNMGCYVDDGVSRTLNGPLFMDATMTPAKCQSLCSAGGYSYAGTEFAVSCYCGSSLTRSIKVADSECNRTCGGDPSLSCGGAYRLSLLSSI